MVKPRMSEEERAIFDKILGIKYCIGLFYEARREMRRFKWCPQNKEGLCCKSCNKVCKRPNGKCADSHRGNGCAYAYTFLLKVWKEFEILPSLSSDYENYKKWESMVHEEVGKRGLEK